MSTLCLTGWQQPHDALSIIAPGALHFDYSGYTDCGALFSALPKTPDLAVGWSLGGQLLARAVAGGYIAPRKLVLLAAPFQWVADARFTSGLALELAQDAALRYGQEPRAMLKNLHSLIALGDSAEKAITRELNRTLQVWNNGTFWLETLTRTSCFDLDFSSFPPTAMLHGDTDKVIFPANSRAFADRIGEAKLQLLPGCAHAPQLHDAKGLREWMENV